jgi:pentatricopeptide repeat domain-containing protein 1
LAEEQQLSQEYCDQLLAECVSRREWDAVWDVVDLTKQQGLGQVKSTYTACLQACFEVSNAATSQDILQAMMDHDEENIQPDPSDIGLTVVTMCRCSSSREGKEQRKEQSKLRKSALQLAKEHEDLPIAAYDAVLSALVEERQWQEAVRLLRSMEQSRPTYSSESRQKQKKTDPALSTYRTVIECCVASNQAEQAVQVLQSCVRRGLTPTVFAFELVVSALSKKLQWRRALQLLELMDQLDVPKTLSMYNAILAATGKGREPVQAKNILRHMRKNGIQPDIISFNSVLSAYASTRRWKDALAVLDEIYREPGVSPDVYTYTK